jgi:hypothetical protein
VKRREESREESKEERREEKREEKRREKRREVAVGGDRCFDTGEIGTQHRIQNFSNHGPQFPSRAQPDNTGVKMMCEY